MPIKFSHYDFKKSDRMRMSETSARKSSCNFFLQKSENRWKASTFEINNELIVCNI